MFRRSDGNTSISPENIAGQSLSVGFRPLPQTTPINVAEADHFKQFLRQIACSGVDIRDIY
ncbi:TPA: hypothetical protein MG637_24350 [Klebsiella pneumoniae]|nr:hypothetical protein [Klebsiella pneumoniae]